MKINRMRNRTKRILKLSVFVCLPLVIGMSVLAVLVLNGTVIPNKPSDELYPVRGIDVSEYQGEIDWNILSAQNIDFAFIKATEGSSYTDSRFEYNLQSALLTDLRVGAYHFFSYDSSGETQAENFINAVGSNTSLLPPVVDVEFYGDYYKNPKNKDDVVCELTDMLLALEDYYGKHPIIYATNSSYKLYIADEFSDDYDIWIRDVIKSPSLSDNAEWTFWQYSDKGKLEGYNGEERFIDLNVYNGSLSDFMQY